MMSRTVVRYRSGPYVIAVLDYRDLWSAVFGVLAYAIYIQQNGVCTCGCVVKECNYCAQECMPEIMNTLYKEF